MVDPNAIVNTLPVVHVGINVAVIIILCDVFNHQVFREIASIQLSIRDNHAVSVFGLSVLQLERLCALATVIDRNLILLIPAQHQLRETAEIGSSIRIHQFCSGIAFHALEIIAVIEVVVRQTHAVSHFV